jgi:hypothetical protein
MAHSKKHEKDVIQHDLPYEPNAVGYKGIAIFGIGLFLLILTTSGLMHVMLGVLESQTREANASKNPMAMTDREKLPPEPRLQLAPGFGVETDEGFVNLELTVPQSEYWVLKKEWAKKINKGTVDEKTGTVISLPVEEAKVKLLEENVMARSGEQAEKDLENSRMFVSDSSAGRVASDKRR